MSILLNKLLCSAGICFGLAGCSSFASTYSDASYSDSSVAAPSSSPIAKSSNDVVDMANHAEVRNQLLGQLNEWKGVPYRYGGLSKQGVDCSGFIHLTFAEEFGIRVPRTTQSQAEKGAVVDQSDLVPGDLVLFQTGYKQRHIGIYVGKKQFIHASSSRGVMMSRLDNPYWQDAYWHARRVADSN